MTITRQVQLFEQTDKIVKAYLTLLLKRFRKIQRSLPFDELNILSEINTQWQEIDSLMRDCLYEIALFYYKLAYRKDYDDQEIAMWYAGLMPGFETWFEDYLGKADPVTHYIFFPESDRKRARLVEAILSVKKLQERKKQLDLAERYIARQLTQTADDVTIAAVLKAFEDMGIKKVEWVTKHDERVCEECEPRDGQIFTLDTLPPLPAHYNCRCFVVPVR